MSGNLDVWLGDLVEHWQDGRIKMYLIRAALTFRREHPELFGEGEFVPLETQGRHASSVIAFLRRTSASCALVAIPRWLSQISVSEQAPHVVDWNDTRVVLPEKSKQGWRNVLTSAQVNAENETILMANDLFRQFPVALCHQNLN
jgi:(1->4)-alpha-D-glucan 1-alpha-D-glucosylmutase